MLSPRILWLCTHKTLRYEEVPLLIEAGAEVIPSFGDSYWLKYDNNYDNETDKMYPVWRSNCTVPTNIVEKIRRIKFWEKRGLVTAKEAELINSWIDVIFIASYPDILSNIRQWYQGYIVYRVFGVGDLTTYTEWMNTLNINIDSLVETDKYIWAPILNSLDVVEDSRITKNKFYLNAFVSKERLDFEWRGRSSEPFLSTAISYLDDNLVTKEIYKDFKEKFSDLPFTVLGKNSKNLDGKNNNKVIGYVDDNEFYSIISRSRVFVYFGTGSNYHLHFTPIEAIAMKVPVIFQEKSGLAQEARDYGITNEELRKIGMCTNTQNIKELVLKTINNFNELERISQRQYDIFTRIFSREAALIKTKEFYNKIQSYILDYRKKHLGW